jgi:hypothetical protein
MQGTTLYLWLVVVGHNASSDMYCVCQAFKNGQGRVAYIVNINNLKDYATLQVYRREGIKGRL